VLNITIEITELRQVQARLLEQASQLEAIFEAQTDGVAVYDLEGRFVRANTALQRLFGLATDAAYTARPLAERAERLQHFDEQGQFLAAEQWPLWRVLRGEIFAGASAMEARVRTLDGREVWVSITGAPIRARDGQITGVVIVTRDVTARHHLEQQVAEQKQELAAILDASPDAVAVCDHNGHIVRVNRALRAALDGPALDGIATLSPLARAEVLQATDAQGRPIPADQLPNMRALRGEILKAETAMDMHLRLPNGRELDVNVAGAPLRDAAGRITGAVIGLRDITARLALERQVTEQANQLEAIFAAMTDGIFVLDAQGHKTRVNPATQALFTLATGEDRAPEGSDLTAAERARILNVRDGAGEPLPAELLPATRLLRGEVLAGATALTLQMGTHPDRIRSVSLTGGPLRDAATGQIVGAVGVVRDVTELQRVQTALAEQERQYRTLVEHSPDIITRFDRTGRHLYANPTAITALGIPAHERLGKTYAELGLPQALYALWERTQQDVFASGEAREFETTSPFGRTGEQTYHYRVRYIPELAADGTVETVLGITSDITELKQTEEALRKATATAEAAREEEERRRQEAERRQAIAESLRDVLAILNSNRSLTEALQYIVRQVETLLGSAAAAILGGEGLLTEGPPSGQVGTEAPAADDLTVQAAVGLQLAELGRHDPHPRLPFAQAAIKHALVSQVPVAVLDEGVLPAAPPTTSSPSATSPSHATAATPAATPFTPATAASDSAAATFAGEPGGERGGGTASASASLLLLSGGLPEPYQTLLVVPIHVQEQIYGCLLLFYTMPCHFSADEIALARAYADQAGLAIMNARVQVHIEREATAAERSRLAHELHDTVTQEIFALSLLAESIPRNWEHYRADAEEDLQHVYRSAQSALALLRVLLFELRPAALEQMTLAELLQQLGAAMTSRAGVPITVEIEGVAEREGEELLVPAPVTLAFYRVAQEALMNAVKYAGASALQVHQQRRRARAGRRRTDQIERIELEIADDGQGFDPHAVPAGHFGLTLMRERAQAVGANVQVRSQAGQGTQVVMEWHSGSQGRTASTSSRQSTGQSDTRRRGGSR
jgi:PAS domain S-box-containing protein